MDALRSADSDALAARGKVDDVVGDEGPAAARAGVGKSAFACAGIAAEQDAFARASDAGGVERDEENRNRAR